MQPGRRDTYPTAQPRTDALLVMAIVTQATPCLTPVPWKDTAGSMSAQFRARLAARQGYAAWAAGRHCGRNLPGSYRRGEGVTQLRGPRCGRRRSDR